MITPKWILDSVRELGLVTMHHGCDEVAAMLAAQLVARLPQDAMRSLADVACARAALDSSDTQQCAADLVKSIVEVLAAGDTEVMSLTDLVGGAWLALNESGAPQSDDRGELCLVDRIQWLSESRRDAWHERDRADDRAADLEHSDANRALAERDRVSIELAAAIKANRHLREENQRLIAQVNGAGLYPEGG